MQGPTRRDAALLVSALALASVVGPSRAATRRNMIYQLRTYEIFDANKAAFHTRFRDHAARIMKRHDFDIAAMWEAKGEKGPEFVYLLRWPDEATLDARWAAFMADAEWSRIKDETGKDGPLVGGIDSRVMRLVDYSPAL